MENSERRRNNGWLEILESQKNDDVFISMHLDAIAKMTLKLEHALANPLHCSYIVAGLQPLQLLCPLLGKHSTFKY